MGADSKIDYIEVKFPKSDPLILDLIRIVYPGLVDNAQRPISWSCSDSGNSIGISIFYGNCGTGTTITDEEQKNKFRSALKEFRRNQKINQIENEGLDKID